MTPRMALVYNFITDFWEDNGYGPSYREIAKGCQMKSISTVHKIVQDLLKRRLIEHGKNMKRWLIPIRPDLLRKRPLWKDTPKVKFGRPKIDIDTLVKRG